MYYCKYWANLSSPSTMHGQFEFKLMPRQRQHKQPVADLSFGALADALEMRMQTFATEGESVSSLSSTIIVNNRIFSLLSPPAHGNLGILSWSL